MRILSKLPLILFALSPILFAAEDVAEGIDIQDPAATMLETESSFARASEEKGTTSAFLEFLAEDSIVFTPGPTDAKQFWSTEKFESVLIWRPSFGCVAEAGDLGYTTGPSEARKTVTDENVEYHGHFATIWKKQTDGKWKVALDIGVSNPPPQQKVKETVPSTCLGTAEAPVKAADGEWQTTQQAFEKELKANAGAALLRHADPQIRILRSGALPAVGLDAARLLLSADRSKVTRTSAGGEVSNSGDIAYTYGSYTAELAAGTETGYFLSVWKTHAAGEWKLALDVQKRLPKPK